MDYSHPFKLVSKFAPTGDQPQAIDQLVAGLNENRKWQVLLGATGTGKTFTMANVIERTQRPALVLVHNKTLAAQEYGEFRELFPHNRVEFFISNFDLYQPEAYIPKTDTYIDKRVQMNMELEMMRAAAVNSLLERHDTIVVATVASIFGLTDPDEYRNLAFTIRVGEEYDPQDISRKLVAAQYHRDNLSLQPGKFRIQGDLLEFMPPSNNESSVIIRVYAEDDTIAEITEVKPLTGEIIHTYEGYPVFPAYEHASSFNRVQRALGTIRQELAERLEYFRQEGKPLEEERLRMRTENDLASLEDFGICAGIENYARHLDGRKPGETPYTLFDYLSEDYILFIDESHVTIPQVGGMYAGDQSRKKSLVDYGFRLPSALDNRPLNFTEFESKVKNAICCSATPGDYELKQTDNQKVEQIIRPTGLVDPQVEVRLNSINPIYDLTEEIKKRKARNERALVIALTIRDAKNLAEYLQSQNLKVAHIQHEIKTMERAEIIYKLRRGDYDCVVGINLLREGLDLPEVSLIGILNTDKEGFLRSERSLIQIIGRAARNADGHVIMYADQVSESMSRAIAETARRRAIQQKYNADHNIVPKTIIKPIKPPVRLVDDSSAKIKRTSAKLTQSETLKYIQELTNRMKQEAKDLNFEEAAKLRDEILELKASLDESGSKTKRFQSSSY